VDLAYPPRRLRLAGNTLLILGLLILASGVGLLVFGQPNVEGEHFIPGLLAAVVGTALVAMGCCLRLMARLGSR
jgi:hypothetical protein